MKLCNCQRSHPVICLMVRAGDKDKNFSECVGGCKCPCHYTENGALIARENWMDNRYRVARALQQAKEERHTDPRIEALMPEKVSER
jgi:hypothetical protein